ncbi:MAG: hypothetical protein HKN81_00090, partial [Gammaproteobacteria bacterium]|nr:hypothetical protein [Gammaproteobacteria bacterium]
MYTTKSVFSDLCSCAHHDIPWLAILATAMLALAGCEGDTGPQGPQGAAGPAGPEGPAGADGGSLPDVSEAAVINAAITGVTIASPPVVTFMLTDERGQGVTGLQGSNLRATVAKLEDGTDGNSSAWQSYINRISEAGEGPGTEDQLQGYRERGDAEGAELIDNGDGTYQYTYATDIMNVTDPIAVT